jgi:hypothetical protein
MTNNLKDFKPVVGKVPEPIAIGTVGEKGKNKN